MKVDYLRISVTDRCNFNCIYCHPYERIKIVDRADLLSYEEIANFVTLATKWGIKKIRLTGGEALIRRNIVELVNMLVQIKGIEGITLTTNGAKLEEFAQSLKSAGLSRVNISLDSLNEKNFTRITGHNDLSKVLRGIKAAQEVGLKPIKINVVVLKGINDEETVDFVKFSQRNSLIVRFIEYMPINGVGRKNWYISNKIIKEKIIERWGKLEPTSFLGSGPAKYFAIKGSSIPIGFISFISHPFCEECNRLRLTSEGKLRPCLISNFEVDIKNALRKENRQTHIKELFDLAMRYKFVRKKKIRKGEISHFNFDKTNRFMFQIGG